MVRILDEDDYRQRLDQAVGISTGEEIGLLLKGVISGDLLGPLRVKNNILYAQQNALVRTRREMLRAIRAENDRVVNGATIPIDVQEIVTGQSDELVKVP